MRPLRVTLAVATLTASAPLNAFGLTPIQVDAQKEFKHKPSGIVLASTAAGIQRSSVQQFDDKQLDVAAEYLSADNNEFTTIYVFRKVSADVPVWFDRIQRAIEARDIYANPTIAIAPAAFAPSGQTNARGLRAVYASGGTSWKSTGAALTTNGDWYVAVRASSKTLPPDQMLTRIEQTFAAIKWAKEAEAAPNTYVVADCPNSLPQGTDAEQVKDDGSTVLMAALLGTVEQPVKEAVHPPTAHWCRDPWKTAGAGIYRPDASTDRYFVAIDDSGRGIMVQPNGLAGILAGATSDGPATFTVEFMAIDQRLGFGSFKTLPSFAQARWLIDHTKPQYATSTWGKQKNINLNPDTFK